MTTITSLSGGMSSAMIEDKFPADFLVFALVRSDNKKTLFPDSKIRQIVSDRIGTEFIGTMEDDTIIYTMLDLEQYFGKYIKWVTDITYEECCHKKGGRLPSLHRRYCTTTLKINPIFNWWHSNFEEPVIMNIGYRIGEGRRVKKQLDSLNENGLSEFKTIIGKHPSGRNKWKNIEWRKPLFPLFENFIDKMDVINNWKGKPVRFAKYNNCVGCFHRSATLLKEMSEAHPNKYDAFCDLETIGKGRFKKDYYYKDIPNMNFTLNLFASQEAEGCNSGFCGF